MRISDWSSDWFSSDLISRDEDFEWFLVTYEGFKDCLFIGEVYEPTKEYRMIVVGDRPVTGAGCIEAFTPLDNIGDPFDDRMANISNRSEAIADPINAPSYSSIATAQTNKRECEHGHNKINTNHTSETHRT